MQLFGYFQTEDEEPEQVISEDISVFTVAKKNRIGEAAGKMKPRGEGLRTRSKRKISQGGRGGQLRVRSQYR